MHQITFWIVIGSIFEILTTTYFISKKIFAVPAFHFIVNAPEAKPLRMVWNVLNPGNVEKGFLDNFLQRIKEDLEFCQCFVFSEVKNDKDNDYEISLTFHESFLKYNIRNLKQGGSHFQGTIELSTHIKKYSATAHQLADIIYESCLGMPGFFSQSFIAILEKKIPASDKKSKSQILNTLALLRFDGMKIKKLIPWTSKELSWPSFQGSRVIFNERYQGKSILKSFDMKKNTHGEALPQTSLLMTSAPILSRDGDHVIFAGQAQNATGIYKFDFKTKETQAIYETKAHLVFTVTYSPDNKNILFIQQEASGKHGVYMIKSDGTLLKPFNFIHKGQYNECAWSPCGRWVSLVKIYKGKYFLSLIDTCHPIGSSDKNPLYQERIILCATLIKRPTFGLPHSYMFLANISKEHGKNNDDYRVVAISFRDGFKQSGGGFLNSASSKYRIIDPYIRSR
jgi:Tol biopolymer transport system component